MEMKMAGAGYDLAILLYIIGILLLAGAMVAQAAGLQLLRRAGTIDQVKLVAKLLRFLPNLFGLPSGLILASGIYLSYLHISEGGECGWLIVAVATFVLMGAYGSALGGRFGRRLGRALAEAKGKMTTEVRLVVTDKYQVGHLMVSAGGFAAVLILMIYQPGPINSIVVTVAALAIGLLAGQVYTGRRPKPADDAKVGAAQA